MSYRIMTEHRYSDQEYYRAACSCYSPQCDISLSLGTFADEISLALDMNVAYDTWRCYEYSDNIFKKLIEWYKIWKRRISGAIKLLFTGRIDMEGEFLFESAEQIYAFLAELEKGALFIDTKGQVRIPLSIHQLNDLEEVLSYFVKYQLDDTNSKEYNNDMNMLLEYIQERLCYSRSILSKGLEEV